MNSGRKRRKKDRPNKDLDIVDEAMESVSPSSIEDDEDDEDITTPVVASN